MSNPSPVAPRARWLLLMSLSIAAAYSDAAQRLHAGHPTRHDLIGVWRLVSIQIQGRDGLGNDPFYNQDSSGILTYDASGWMSVQIVGKSRPALAAAASRPPTAVTEDAQTKAALFDTYYAYFGTWTFEEARSTVVHHIESSLISGEAGMNYSQTVSLAGENLIFTVRSEGAGGTIQKKVWARISSP